VVPLEFKLGNIACRSYFTIPIQRLISEFTVSYHTINAFILIRPRRHYKRRGWVISGLTRNCKAEKPSHFFPAPVAVMKKREGFIYIRGPLKIRSQAMQDLVGQAFQPVYTGWKARAASFGNQEKIPKPCRIWWDRLSSLSTRAGKPVLLVLGIKRKFPSHAGSGGTGFPACLHGLENPCY